MEEYMPFLLLIVWELIMRHFIFGVLSCLLINSAWAEPLQIVTTFSLLQDITQRITQDKAKVYTLVGANEDAHVYEPKPVDIKLLKQSQVVIVNGLGFEGWMERLVQSAQYKGVLVTASEGIKTLSSEDADEHEHQEHHAHGKFDPHAWQNVANVQQYVRNIKNALVKIDSVNAAEYERNAEAYIQELQNLDQWIQQQIAAVPVEKRKVVSSHDAFRYFEQAYGVQFLAAQGVNTESQSSAKNIAKLIQQMRQEKIKTVFVENISDPRLVSRIAKEANGVLGEPLFSDALSKKGEGAETYIELMKSNVLHLKKGMLID